MKHSFITSYIATVLLALLLSACDGFIYDGEGNCDDGYVEPGPAELPPEYKAQFVYDYNMDYADLFDEQVSYINLYLADTNGNILWQGTDTAPNITQEGYLMDLPVDAGTYSLLLWGGTTEKGSFTVPASATTLSELTATLARNYNGDGAAYSDVDLDRWFYAYLPNQVFPPDEGTYVYTLSLLKDTNIFHISLTDENGVDIDPANFSFAITADNGFLNWDNSLLADETINYFPWATRSATLTADLTTSRLVNGYDQRLKVYNNGTEIINIPLIDDLLLIKKNYTQEMSDQEFLDREDEWTLSFTIAQEKEEEGDKYYWLPAVIYINSWRVVLQDTGL